MSPVGVRSTWAPVQLATGDRSAVTTDDDTQDDA
ncbi:hypothetical protein Q760_06565 [Cellulomonas cellasea DSM 20118]|uniref:Uncharacterized protein n=1 Tax=Cellulomonas cellasea DSM 20118 TaxID=1408250 RepID=A0A0A0BD83_9CELL|nr:hypothetical protein Q760_06565 [Cellulomonas cellasea DSM 20118]